MSQPRGTAVPSWGRMPAMLDPHVVARRLAAVTASAILLAGAPALAQDRDAAARLDEGVAAYEEGRFDDARAHLDAAAELDGLDRDALVRWVSTRVLVAQGLGDDAALESALLQLVTLDPGGLGANASPALARGTARALEQTGGATVAIEVDHAETDEGLAVRPRIRGDVGGLVRGIELRARSAGGEWVASDGEVVLPAAAAADVEVIAVARGPGGAPVATLGDDDAPHHLATSAPAAALAPASETASEEGDDGVLIGVLVAVGIAVVAGAVVTGVVLGTQGDPQTDLTGPVVEW